MLRVGLTGGIASGKSTVMRLFEALGAVTIDTDEVAREVVRPGTAGLAAVVQAFGAGILTTAGALDRAAMRRRILADAAARKRLESILHPLIRARTLALLEAATGPYVIVAVPLLVETGFSELVHRVLVVDCPVDVQLARLIGRDGVSEPEARAAIAAQTDRTTRLAVADDVIDNSAGLEKLSPQVEALHERYRAMGHNCSNTAGRAE